jgi:hypothetical protein
MATPVDVGQAFLEAIREISSLLKEWISGADIRRMKAAIEAGEKYIFTNEKDEKDKEKMLKYWRDRFFKYN